MIRVLIKGLKKILGMFGNLGMAALVVKFYNKKYLVVFKRLVLMAFLCFHSLHPLVSLH